MFCLGFDSLGDWPCTTSDRSRMRSKGTLVWSDFLHPSFPHFSFVLKSFLFFFLFDDNHTSGGKKISSDLFSFEKRPQSLAKNRTIIIQ